MNALSLSAVAYLLAAGCAVTFAYLVRRRWPSLFKPVVVCLALGVISAVAVSLAMFAGPGAGVLGDMLLAPAVGPLLLIAQAGDTDPVALILLVPLMAAIEVGFAALAVTLLVRWWRSRSHRASPA